MSQFKTNISIPARVHHVACLMKDPPRDSPLVKNEFHQLLSYFKIESGQIFEEKKMGLGIKIYPNGDRLLIYWRLDTEYYSYQTWQIPSDPSRELSFGPVDLPDYLFQSCPLGTRITWMDILFQVRSQTLAENEVKNYFQGPEIYGFNHHDKKKKE